MKKKVMIFTNSDSGLYDFRKEVLQAFMRENMEVLVSVPQGNYKDRIEALGCAYLPTKLERRGMNPVKDMQLFFQYWKFLRQYQPDVVLTYTVKPNVYGGIACRIKRIPYLVNITGLGTALENKSKVQTLIVRLYRAGLKKAACVFFQNAYNEAFMRNLRCISGRTRTIPGSGVNLTEHAFKEYPAETQEIRLLAVTRIMEAKGIRELLKVIPRICREYPKVTFEIAGAYEEESREEFEPVINRLQEQGILRYYGYREDVPEIMANAHIVVNPSYSEGMSNVLLEASATGRPVVATDIQGCRETFQEGITGYGCKVKNSDSLYEALCAILSLTNEERAQMGKEARAFVEKRFDRRQVTAAYIEEVKKLLQ